MTIPKRWLGLMIAAQTLTLLAVWGVGPTVAPARADGIPDAGAQQQAVIDQLKATNAKLDRVIAALTGGQIEVKFRKADEPARSR